MNCKQGDLAVIVRGDPAGKNFGRIVRCKRFVGRHRHSSIYSDFWEVDVPIYFDDDTVAHLCSDSTLRPIRDQDGEDEILRIAGKPETVGA